MAHRCGALALEETVRTELSATGARPRGLLLTGVDSLTPVNAWAILPLEDSPIPRSHRRCPSPVRPSSCTCLMVIASST
jgi:hypothetical protein